MDINKTILLGTALEDPQVSSFDDGDKFANVRVATLIGGAKQIHSLKFKGAQAAIIANNLKKGMQIYVDGHLEYSTSKLGINYMDIVVHRFQLDTVLKGA